MQIENTLVVNLSIDLFEKKERVRCNVATCSHDQIILRSQQMVDVSIHNYVSNCQTNFFQDLLLLNVFVTLLDVINS